MPKYLIDTSALVDWLKGVRHAVDLFGLLAEEEHALAVCSIVVAETFSGIARDDWPSVAQLLDPFEYWAIDQAVAQQAGRYRYEYARKGQQLAVTDTLIAALAVENDAILVTGNVRDFPMPELKVQRLPG